VEEKASRQTYTQEKATKLNKKKQHRKTQMENVQSVITWGGGKSEQTNNSTEKHKWKRAKRDHVKKNLAKQILSGIWK
jgi:hypothetical protein